MNTMGLAAYDGESQTPDFFGPESLDWLLGDVELDSSFCVKYPYDIRPDQFEGIRTDLSNSSQDVLWRCLLYQSILEPDRLYVYKYDPERISPAKIAELGSQLNNVEEHLFDFRTIAERQAEPRPTGMNLKARQILGVAGQG